MEMVPRHRLSSKTRSKKAAEKAAALRAYKKRVAPDVSPDDTLLMEDDEYRMLYHVYRHGGRFGYWRLINCKDLINEPRFPAYLIRQKILLALMRRLIAEKKLYRNCKMCEIQLLPKGEDRIRELACVNPPLIAQ